MNNDLIDAQLIDPLNPNEKITDDKENPLTVRQVCKMALVNHSSQNDTPEQKTKRWEVFLKIQDCDLNDLESEEITEVKNCVGGMYTTAVYGQIAKALEGKDFLQK